MTATDPREQDLPTCYRHPDRHTGLSCTECGRPICGECMRPSPVGQRCPHCAAKERTTVVRPRALGGRPTVTISLIAICVVAYFLTGGSSSGVGASSLLSDADLSGVGIAAGNYYELVTSMFMHASILHLLFNMYALWIVGPLLEQRYGHGRFLALYVVAGLAGGAGALALTAPYVHTVGASGAIFGIMTAVFVVERRHGVPMMGGIGIWLVLNIVLTFSIPGISIGGHIGGIIGGGLAAIGIERYGRPGGRPNAAEIAILAGIGIVSVALAIYFAHNGPLTGATR